MLQRCRDKASNLVQFRTPCDVIKASSNTPSYFRTSAPELKKRPSPVMTVKTIARLGIYRKNKAGSTDMNSSLLTWIFVEVPQSLHSLRDFRIIVYVFVFESSHFRLGKPSMRLLTQLTTESVQRPWILRNHEWVLFWRWDHECFQTTWASDVPLSESGSDWQSYSWVLSQRLCGLELECLLMP